MTCSLDGLRHYFKTTMYNLKYLRLRVAGQCGRIPYQDFKIIIEPHFQRVVSSPNQTGLRNCHLLSFIKMLYFTRQLVEDLQDQDRKTT